MREFNFIKRLMGKPAGQVYFGQSKAAVYVRIVVATIFDFMTEEDWGE